MTTYATAEAARQQAIAALRAAGLTAEADRLAALPAITDRETAYCTRTAAHDAASAAYHTADRAAEAAAARAAYIAWGAAYADVAAWAVYDTYDAWLADLAALAAARDASAANGGS